MKNTIKEALEDHSFKYVTTRDDENRTVFELGMKLENGRCDTNIHFDNERKTLCIYVVSPCFVPSNRRGLVSEYLTRANYGLVIGNFEMDFDDGEIRYKASYVCDEAFSDSKEVFIRNLFISFNTMDKYLPGIMAVMYANVPPVNAVAQIENVTDPSMN